MSNYVAMSQSAPRITHDQPQRVLILGSTGSVGVQALDVIAAHPDAFDVVGLVAGGAHPELLAQQAARFAVPTVAVGTESAAEDTRTALNASSARSTQLLAGSDAILDLIESTKADVVLNGIDGSRGLAPTLSTLKSGARLALANKESLIAGGPLVLKAAAPGQIVPVDSEHSALAQCLRGGTEREVAKLVVTASGGPFRGRGKADLAEVTVDDALAHPTWSMGPLITINSATLVNKGLEVIEAHLLFGVPYERIDVIVHPQSMVHSMVTFTDGSTLAQASTPDMRIPISLALGWPHRLASGVTQNMFESATTWTFEPLNEDVFPSVRLARQAGITGGCLPAVFNAANEEAVSRFLGGGVGFTGIVDTVQRVLDMADEWSHDPNDVSEVLAAEQWARRQARKYLV